VLVARRTLIACGLAAPAIARAREVTDDAGRRVVLPPRVARVFAAGPPASIALFALAPETLLGWTSRWREAEKAFVDERWANLPVTGRLTGRGGTANLETVLALRPDLILDYGAVSPTFVSLADRVQAQTGIPVVLLDGRFDAIAASFRTLGRMLGREADGHALAAYADAVLADLDRRVGAIPEAARPRVYYGRGPNGLQTGLAGSINVETLERVRARNVAAALGAGGLTTVTMEQILLWNPEVVVTTDPTFFAGVQRDPLWRSVAALRTGRVHVSPPNPFGWIDFPPGPNRLIGVRWLARVLYPQAFPEDLREPVAEFYARFYHRRPSEAQLDTMLATLERVAAA
jgi:iron complex transport system substrate-binding protein